MGFRPCYRFSPNEHSSFSTATLSLFSFLTMKEHLFTYMSLLVIMTVFILYQNSNNVTLQEKKMAWPSSDSDAVHDVQEKLINLMPDLAISDEFQSAATGHQFTGEKFRTFSEFMFQDEAKTLSLASSTLQNVSKTNCKKWGVLTTIMSPPTEAIRRFLYKQDWCVAVVADLNRPKVRI